MDGGDGPPGAASAISLEGITKRYGEVAAVDDLSLQIDPGELLVLVGPSGCGKSTVLRLIAGLDEPTAGTVRIAGEVVNGIDPKDRDVAMVFQSYALYPHMTVARNIEFPLRARRVPKAERERSVAGVARNLQIDHLLKRKPAALSGGQRQRVALARAIVRRPRAFLMDEPLSNLDAQLRIEMRAALVELQARLGTTVVYVTHDQVEAVTMGQRIAILDSGRLQQVATPAEVQARPANAFVAAFIGSPPMNVMPATLEPGEVTTGTQNAGRHLAVAGGVLPLTGAQQAALGARDLTTVLAGIRAEDLQVDPEGSVRATVSFVESFGAERIAACRLPATGAADGQLVMVRISAGGRAPRTGEAVTLGAHAPASLFDPATGARLDA
ncbi:MAG: ABC transporter ATP-binding protein [Actinomycetota bacterium]|nr:ABC transporter ATP-binding protein [Actinomycetota bacterium]